MEPQLQPQRKILQVLLGLFLLVILVCGVYLFIKNDDKMSSPSGFISNYAQFKDSRQGDFGTTSVRALQSYFDNAPDNKGKSVVSQSLIEALYKRNVGDDRAKSISLAADIVGDSTLDPRSRAITLTLMGTLLGLQDRAFFQQYFSSNPAFSKYLPEKGVEVEPVQVLLNMFKDAETIYPTAYAEYNIAYFYDLLVRRGELANGLKNQEDMARVVQDYIAKADQASKTDMNYTPSTLASFYHQRALALSNSSRILNNKSVNEREAIYKDALDKISKLPSDSYVESYLFQTRFRYAIFLFVTTSGREGDIKLTLQDFGSLNPNEEGDELVGNYFRILKDIPPDNSIKEHVINLSKISPSFKSFVEKVGWKV